MSEPREGTSAALERAIGRVLRAGTTISSVLLVLALAMAVAGYTSGPALTFATSGILILLATPVARVLVSVVGYVRQRDWTFVALTVMVLLTLAASVVAAFWGG
jgi:uncharacterized membrane protein